MNCFNWMFYLKFVHLYNGCKMLFFLCVLKVYGSSYFWNLLLAVSVSNKQWWDTFAALRCVTSCVCHMKLFVRHWPAVRKPRIICVMLYTACWNCMPTCVLFTMNSRSSLYHLLLVCWASWNGTSKNIFLYHAAMLHNECLVAVTIS